MYRKQEMLTMSILFYLIVIEDNTLAVDHYV